MLRQRHVWWGHSCLLDLADGIPSSMSSMGEPNKVLWHMRSQQWRWEGHDSLISSKKRDLATLRGAKRRTNLRLLSGNKTMEGFYKMLKQEVILINKIGIVASDFLEMGRLSRFTEMFFLAPRYKAGLAARRLELLLPRHL